MFVRALIGAILSFCWAAPNIAVADEFKPLSTIYEDAAPIYPFVRCGGMYQAVMEWSGQERMGDKVWARTDEVRLTITVAAVLIGRKSGLRDNATNVVLRDVKNVADIYLRRFETNFAREGHAFGKDPLMSNDQQFCKDVYAFSRTIVSGSGDVQ